MGWRQFDQLNRSLQVEFITQKARCWHNKFCIHLLTSPEANGKDHIKALHKNLFHDGNYDNNNAIYLLTIYIAVLAYHRSE